MRFGRSIESIEQRWALAVCVSPRASNSIRCGFKTFHLAPAGDVPSNLVPSTLTITSSAPLSDTPSAPSPMTANKNLIISAVSNFSTAYNLVIINIAHVIMEYQYCGGDKCKAQVDLASTACLAGAIVGQLTFGYVGDCMGRGPALQLTMAMSIFGALLSAFAVPIGDNGNTVFTFISVTRFLLGVGVGGVYPLAATISTESSSQADRGRNASLVFSMQGIANLLAPIVAWVLLLICGVPHTKSGTSDLGMAWRLALGLGALPGILLLPFKTTPKTGPASNSLEEPIAAVNREKAPSLSLWQALRMRKYWGKLLGTAGGWFFFDITFYGNSLFQSTVLEEVFEVAHRLPHTSAG